MVGKTANQKRKEWINAVKAADKLKRQKRYDEARKKKAPKPDSRRKTKPHGLCCTVVMANDMPTYFRPCPDCPNKELNDLVT